MESSGPEGIDGVYCTSNKPKEAEESRIFNASGTLCNHMAAGFGEKDDNFPTIATKIKANGHDFSYDCDILSSSINRTCSSRKITSSETSKLLSLCPGHNSFSENAESQAGLGVSDLSDDIEILASTGQSFSENNYKHIGPNVLGDYVSLTVGSSSSCKMIGHCIGEAFQKHVSREQSLDNGVSPMEEVFDDTLEKKEASSESTLTHLGNLSNQDCTYSEWQGSISMKVDPAMTVRNMAAENSDRRNQRGSNEKSDMLLGEPNSQSHTVNSIGESDNESVEVRVCDTCGDVGREALLAICSNCSDGAEHTYCMRVMLTEVPGDWTCEECIMEREKEKLKHDELDKGGQNFRRTSSLNESRQISENFGCFNSQSRTELDIKGSGKRRLKKITSGELLAKKSISELEALSKTRRKSREICFRSSRVTTPCNKSQSLKNSSTIDLDKWKIKPAYGLTASAQSFAFRTLGGASSSVNTGHRAERLQQRPELVQGSLVKSKSFAGIDSKVSSQFQREDKMMSKSMSFNRVSSNCSKNSRVKSLKRLRQEKEFNPSQKRHKLDQHNLLPRKPDTRCDASKSESYKGSPSMSSPKIGTNHSLLRNDKWNFSTRLPSALPTSKFDQGSSVSKAMIEKINLSKSSQMVDSGVTMAKTDKMKLLNSTSMVGSCPTSKTRGGKLLTSSAMSGSGGCTLTTYKAKLLPSAPMNASGGPISKTGFGNHSGSPVPMSSSAPKSNTNKEKLSISSTTGDSYVSTSKTSKGNISVSSPMTQSVVSTLTYSGKLLTSSSMSASTVSSSKSSEKNPKSSLRKDVSASMTRERASSINTRVTKLSSASRCFNSNVAVEHGKSISLSKGDRHLIQKGLNYDRNKVFSDLRQHNHPSDSVSAVKERLLCDSSPDENLIFSVSPVIATSNFASPEFDRIWLGDFDIYKCKKLPSTFGGIQAHLSMNASPKAVEAVLKFPKKLLLQEVPRTSIWPSQFFQNQATEDNIALFFFAEDIESFEKTYKNLVQCMVDKDLALKGNFGEFDLLIFSSNLLPERSQRWNKLLFIWGVFRGKSVQCQSSEPIVSSEMMNGISTLQQSPIVTSDRTLCGSEAYFEQQKCSKSLGGSGLRSLTHSLGKPKLLSEVAPESDAFLNEQMEYKTYCKVGLESTSEVKDYNQNEVRVPGEREYMRNRFSSSELSSSSSIEDATGILAFGGNDIDFSTSGHTGDKIYDATGYGQERTKVSADSGCIDDMLRVNSTRHPVHLKDAEKQKDCGVIHSELSSTKEETHNRLMFPLWGPKNDEEIPTRADFDYQMNIDKEMTVPLSLSLQLPCSNENQFSESNTSRKSRSSKESGVNTPVYLFGSILKS